MEDRLKGHECHSHSVYEKDPFMVDAFYGTIKFQFSLTKVLLKMNDTLENQYLSQKGT